MAILEFLEESGWTSRENKEYAKKLYRLGIKNKTLRKA